MKKNFMAIDFESRPFELCFNNRQHAVAMLSDILTDEYKTNDDTKRLLYIKKMTRPLTKTEKEAIDFLRHIHNTSCTTDGVRAVSFDTKSYFDNNKVAAW